MFQRLFEKITENVGKSINLIAQIVYIVYIIQVIIAVVSFIASMIFLFQLIMDECDESALIFFIVCLVLFLVSVMTALLSVVMLYYAFRELVNSNKKISKNANLIIKNRQDTNKERNIKTSNGYDEKKIIDNLIHNVPQENTSSSDYVDIECSNCHNIVSVSKKTIANKGSVICTNCHNKII